MSALKMKERHYVNEWPPERVDELKRLFAEGHPFSTIASSLAMTRSAVIGKCNRLGLTRSPPPKPKASFQIRNRSTSAKEGNALRKLRQPSARSRNNPAKNKTLQKLIAGPKFVRDFDPVNPNPAWLAYDAAIPPRRRKRIQTLTPTSCRYIVGDPAQPGFFFCGARKVPTLPYCAEHARRCYAPAKRS